MLEFFISWIVTLIAIRFFILRKKPNSATDDIDTSNSTKDAISIVVSLLLTIFITIIQWIIDFFVIGSLSRIIIDLIK